MRHVLPYFQYVLSGVLLGLLFFLPATAAAVTDPFDLKSSFERVGQWQAELVGGTTSLSGLLLNIIRAVLFFAAIIALAVIIIGGLMYITSLGDDKKIGRAKTLLISAIIGLIIIGAAGIVVNIVISVLKR